MIIYYKVPKAGWLVFVRRRKAGTYPYKDCTMMKDPISGYTTYPIVFDDSHTPPRLVPNKGEQNGNWLDHVIDWKTTYSDNRNRVRIALPKLFIDGQGNIRDKDCRIVMKGDAP